VNAFQRRLNDRRIELRLSYPELAKRSGIPHSTTWRILNGPMVEPPKREQLEGLAKALDWPLTFLQQGAAEALGFHLYTDRSGDMEVLIASLEELTPQQRRGIQRMVEELRRENSE
jgi:transcriptional regulator with XRE-family HTH domain